MQPRFHIRAGDDCGNLPTRSQFPRLDELIDAGTADVEKLRSFGDSDVAVVLIGHEGRPLGRLGSPCIFNLLPIWLTY